jgi:hypothetical protein
VAVLMIRVDSELIGRYCPRDLFRSEPDVEDGFNRTSCLDRRLRRPVRRLMRPVAAAARNKRALPHLTGRLTTLTAVHCHD